MLTWVIIIVATILVYVVICFLFEDRLEKATEHKYLAIPTTIFLAPIMIFFAIKDGLEESPDEKPQNKKVAEKKRTELPYTLSESTIRRIQRDGITYRDRN